MNSPTVDVIQPRKSGAISSEGSLHKAAVFKLVVLLYHEHSTNGRRSQSVHWKMEKK